MKVVVDTNIVFSAILSPNNKIAELILKSKNDFKFFAPNQLSRELNEHENKALQLTGYSRKEYNEIKDVLLSRVQIISDILISPSALLRAEELLKDVDPDDTVFLALALDMDARLWTGDTKLSKGLKKKDIYNTVSANELYRILLNRELGEKD